MGYELLLQVYNNNLNGVLNFIKKKPYFCTLMMRKSCYSVFRQFIC